MTRHPTNRLAVAVLAVHLVGIEVAIAAGWGFDGLPGGRVTGAVLVAVLFGVPVLGSLVRGSRQQTVAERAVLLLALLVIVRFHAARIMNGWYAERFFPQPTPLEDPTVARVERHLREIVAAQEQYRLTHLAYAPSVDSLRAWLEDAPGVTVRMTGHAASGWSAEAELAAERCTVWVRDTTLRTSPDATEGAPLCSHAMRPLAHQRVHTIVAAADPEVRFLSAEVSGEWRQHRSDDRRTATVASDVRLSKAVGWNSRVSGELIASRAAAGGQVFVGAHGNGEFAALHLTDGVPGFRLRAPNWIHHEPVITAELAVIGFGNNETGLIAFPQSLGSGPSGVVAYSRATGVERWRHYTTGSVMTSPVLTDSLVIANSSDGRLTAWSIRSGDLRWQARLPGSSAMGNPLFVNGTVVIGVEPTTVCAYGANSGERRYCHAISRPGMGAGHASPATDGTRIFQVINGPVSILDAMRDRLWLILLRRLAGVPDRFAQQVIVAMDAATGAELWSTNLGIGDQTPAGHTAGTPTVAGNVVLVPSPISGRVYALDRGDGRVLWFAGVNPARGSVTIAGGAVLVATRDTSFIALDLTTGARRCQQRLPGVSDRAGPTVIGTTGILALRDGWILARPVDAWVRCGA